MGDDDKKNPQLAGAHTRLEMGLMRHKLESEFDEDGHFSPISLVRRTHGSSDQSPDGSFSEALQEVRSTDYFKNSVFRSSTHVILKAKINLMLPFGPAAILVHKFYGHQGLVFILSLLGIIPLAERLGYATEQLAFFTGATVGGLLNATFGNATELIISIFALKSGMIRVVQQSLLGSILSNMLLVLGCAFFCGGIVFLKKDQTFNKSAAVVNSGLLLMAVMGILFPALLHYTHSEAQLGKSELALSRFSSCIMLLAYACYLVFQLKSHRNLYDPVREGASQIQSEASSHGDEEEEVADISKWEAIVWLAIITACISVLSEYLVDAIQGASVSWKIPVPFISVVLLPIVGNAAEHASAIMFAMKDKLDISLGVAIGSSTQISMFGVRRTRQMNPIFHFLFPISLVSSWPSADPLLRGRRVDLGAPHGSQLSHIRDGRAFHDCFGRGLLIAGGHLQLLQRPDAHPLLLDRSRQLLRACRSCVRRLT